MTRPVHLRRMLAAAAGGLLAAMAMAPAASAQVPDDFVGITSDDVFAASSRYRDRNLRKQRRIGVRLIRQTFSWKSIERRPGRYSLGPYDRYVAALAKRGIRVLPIIFQAPRFYARPRRGRAECPPRINATMASLAKVLVERYGSNGTLWSERTDVPKLPIRSWQVWNEPSLAIYWCGRANAIAYAAMLKEVGGAIKQADPAAEVVTAGIPPSKLRSAVRLPKYLRQLYAAGAGDAFDTLAINSYAKNTGELGRLLRSVRKLMNRSGDGSTPIWLTEMGWGDKGPKHRFIVGRRGQARRISKAVGYIRRVRGALRLRGFVYYSWRDLRPYPPRYQDLWGLHTGLLNRRGKAKPAFRAFRRSVRKLR